MGDDNCGWAEQQQALVAKHLANGRYFDACLAFADLCKARQDRELLPSLWRVFHSTGGQVCMYFTPQLILRKLYYLQRLIDSLSQTVQVFLEDGAEPVGYN